jgi:hypothetical protein
MTTSLLFATHYKTRYLQTARHRIPVGDLIPGVQEHARWINIPQRHQKVKEIGSATGFSRVDRLWLLHYNPEPPSVPQANLCSLYGHLSPSR